MRNLTFLIFTCICSFGYSQQDITIFVQAKQVSKILDLDAIYIENLSNGTSTNIFDLPKELSTYEINLTQGAILQTAENNNFKLISNQPGFSCFSIKSSCADVLYLDLFNIYGQTIYKASMQMNAGINTFNFHNSYPSISILRLKTSNEEYFTKVVGEKSQLDKLSLAEHINSEFFIENTKSFSYKYGDTIKLSVKKQGYHKNLMEVVPINKSKYVFYLSQPCPDIATVSDYDGNIYNTVQIGNQCWMKENLKSTHYADGTALTNGSAIVYNGYDTYENIFYNFNDNDSLAELTGKLYTLEAALNGRVTNPDELENVQRQGVCPNGWHVPNDEEWSILESYIDNTIQEDPYFFGLRGLNCGTNLKSNLLWTSANGTDMYGFSILPGGRKEYNVVNRRFEYSAYKYGAYFWEATYYQGNGIYRFVIDTSEKIGRGSTLEYHAYSVRCIKD
ncbi:MAG TPA: FISUMP domain-containing protein [Bacteroidales bacterium]|nr:FISUMP domain-containing protein [Bacteroidales bacterium]HPL05213.1 FISUMP domain-containing protein [Bacteroidales bacterium]